MGDGGVNGVKVGDGGVKKGGDSDGGIKEDDSGGARWGWWWQDG